MILALLSALVIAAGVGYWLVSYRARTRGPTRRSMPFGSVEIEAHGIPCDAARILDGRRFLSKQAPALPLPECDAEQCRCTFVKYSDRRTEDERRLNYGGLSAAWFVTRNRRNRGDRRKAKSANPSC